MSKQLFLTSFVFLVLIVAPVMSQKLVCKTAALAAWRTIPALKYKCREDLTDSDDAVLTQPHRINALKLYAKSLEKFTFADWWNTKVEDLDVCDFRKKPGALSKDEKYNYTGGNYFFALLGNNQFRVMVVRDPCYQLGFSGSNIFLLNRLNGRVFASEIIDGFYTRADYPQVVDFARNGREQIIEIGTMSGGLYATITNYYFTIDPKTNRAVPKNLFLDDGQMTNQISSMMLLGEPEEYGLAPRSEALQIIKNGRLAKSFDVFADTYETFGEDNHQKFSKLTLRWNGKVYE